MTAIDYGALGGANGTSNGRLEMHRIGDVTVLEHIQRIPKDSRVKALGRNGWQAKKQGILLVARITDGEHAGTLHVYDGGTRWRLGLATVGRGLRHALLGRGHDRGRGGGEVRHLQHRVEEAERVRPLQGGHRLRRAAPDRDQAGARQARARRRRRRRATATASPARSPRSARGSASSTGAYKEHQDVTDEDDRWDARVRPARRGARRSCATPTPTTARTTAT